MANARSIVRSATIRVDTDSRIDGRRPDALQRDTPRSAGRAPRDAPAVARADLASTRSHAARRLAGRTAVQVHPPGPSSYASSVGGSLRFSVGAAFSGRPGGVAKLGGARAELRRLRGH